METNEELTTTNPSKEQIAARAAALAAWQEESSIRQYSEYYTSFEDGYNAALAAAGVTPQEPGERERLAEVERAAAEKAWDEGAEAAFYNPEIRGFVEYPDNPYRNTKEEHDDQS